jgi:hypothetical protein
MSYEKAFEFGLKFGELSVETTVFMFRKVYLEQACITVTDKDVDACIAGWESFGPHGA